MEYIIGIVPYFMFCTGLFLTARYMDKSYALLSFVPIVQFYVMVSLAGYGTVLFSAICAIIVMGIVLGPIAVIILYFIQAYLLYQVGMRTLGKGAPSILAAILPPIGMLWIGIELHIKGKKETPKNKVQIKVMKCPNCNARQQVRVGSNKHTCSECKKVLTLKRKTPEKKEL